MKADALALTKLYDTLNKAYVVPSYQRPFAWDASKAIDLLDALLEDAIANAKITSVGTFLFCEVRITSGQHPFGNNSPGSDAPNTVWEVVDGQQRLTVFSILGFALKKRLEALTAQGLTYSPPLEFELLFLTSRRKVGKNVPVLIRDEDNFDKEYKSDLAHLLNSFAGNEPFPPQIGKRLFVTYEAIVEWVSTNLDKTKFMTFADYLLSRCQIVQVLADDQNSAFTMFEPLNSTSEPLTAFEVYRSKAVRAIQPAPAFMETLKLLDYDNTKRDEVIKKSNTLIFATAQARSGIRPRVHFVQLKNYLDGNVSSAFVPQFETGAEFFHSVWLSQTSTEQWFDEETRNGVRFLRASQHDAAMPVILRYFLTERTNVPLVVRTIVAFYTLWRPAFPTNKLPDIYRSLLTSGQPDDMSVSYGTLKTPQQLAAYFRGKLESRLGPLGAGETFEGKWLADPAQVFLDYEQLRTICRLFILIDIGASLKSNLVPDDPWTSLDDIDHILPTSTQAAPANINRLGNLTFLPPSLNKSIKAMAWTDKREIYGLLASPQKQSPPPTQFSDGRALPTVIRDYLADPKSLALAHLLDPAQSASWGEAEIRVRTQKMLKNVWGVLYGQWLQ